MLVFVSVSVASTPLGLSTSTNSFDVFSTLNPWIYAVDFSTPIANLSASPPLAANLYPKLVVSSKCSLISSSNKPTM